MDNKPTILDTYYAAFSVLRRNGFSVGKVRRDGSVRATMTVFSLTRPTVHLEVIAQADGQAYITARWGSAKGGIIRQGTDKGEAARADLNDVAATAVGTAHQLQH